MKLSSFFHFAAFGVQTILLRKKSPILGTVIVTDKCNLHCKHCSVNNITAIVHPYEQIWQEMQRLYDMGVRILFFCGGETFLWKDGERTLRDLVIEAKNMGFLIVNVVTNGTFPIDLPEADLILLSLDGDKQRHNEVRGDTYDTMTSKTSRVQPTPERSPRTAMGAKFPSMLMVQSIWTDIPPPARSCSRQPPACMTGS